MDVTIKILWVVVLSGLAALFLGAFDRHDAISAGMISPDGELLVLRTHSGTLSTYNARTLGKPIAHTEFGTGIELLAWVDSTAIVARDGRRVFMLDTAGDLERRPWFESDSQSLLLAIRGRTLVGIDAARPEAPIHTFALANFAVAEEPAPAAGAPLPFERVLTPIDALPDGVTLENSEGRLTLHHPAHQQPTQIALPRPRLIPAAGVLVAGVVLIVLRHVRRWQRRRPRDEVQY